MVYHQDHQLVPGTVQYSLVSEVLLSGVPSGPPAGTRGSPAFTVSAVMLSGVPPGPPAGT